MSYGNFVTALVTFLITAVVVYYAVVLPLGRLNERLGLEPEPPLQPRRNNCCIKCRILLKKG